MTEPAGQATPEQILLNTRVIHLAMLGGLVMFLGITLFLSQDDLFFQPVDAHPFFYVVVVFTITVFAVMGVVLKPIIARAREQEDELKQWTQFQVVSLVRFALLEGACLISVVALFLRHNLVYLVPAAILFLAMLVQAPSRDGFEKMMQTGPYRRNY